MVQEKHRGPHLSSLHPVSKAPLFPETEHPDRQAWKLGMPHTWVIRAHSL